MGNRNHSNGFTLVEVLLMLVVATLGMFAVIQMSSVGMKAQKGVQDSSEINSFGTTFQQILGVGTVCTANLLNTPFDRSLVDAAGTGVLQAQNLEIDYPKPGPTAGTFIKDPANCFIRAAGPGCNTYAGWTVSSMGLRVLAPPVGDLSFIRLEVNFSKTNPGTSTGSSGGRKFTTTLLVATAGAGNSVTAQACGYNSTGWVPIPPSMQTIQNSPTRPADNAWYSTDAHGSPDDICQLAGFTSFTGACRGTVSGVSISGSVMANQIGGIWNVSCAFGVNGQGWYPTEILCTQ